ncbi:glycosyltransferase [Bifidobacterium sp. H6bp9]|uniref:glycosyltransferase n=1 Tax=Bifidobacterium sp. H6bp9 TaxID=3051961 RepID=UPI0028BE6ADB|nr:glycosyltransferase [Bifidobacterium sp. H6bp9]MDT7510281.1 glycosyltransferase [Bifidobacterium sp. H6bp9]
MRDHDRLTLALVLDSFGNRGNGTSNSAIQYAQGLEALGHRVRLVGVGSTDYPARVHRIPLVSRVAARQQMSFARADPELFRRAFAGVDLVHIYEPFVFGRAALAQASSMGIPVTAGFHIQPENITYSAGPLRWLPGVDSAVYRLFRFWLYDHVRHIHVPTQLTADLLRSHGYKARLHVISNGYQPRFNPGNRYERDRYERQRSDRLIQVAASGRLAREKDHLTLIRALALCRNRRRISLTIAGTGPMERRLKAEAARQLDGMRVSIGFHQNATMPDLLRRADLLVHPSIADLESVSVLEGMACGAVPIIARSDLSAAGHFALTQHSLFPVGKAWALAEQIDWWIDHPDALAVWSGRYAEHAKEHYSLDASVKAFAHMAMQAVSDQRAGAGIA